MEKESSAADALDQRPKLKEEILEQFKNANEARDYTIYTRLMDAALEAKAESIFPYFNIEEGDVIVDAGSGTGALSELAAQEFHGAHVYALDISHELQERAEAGKALTKLVYGDASKVNFPENSVQVKFYSTSGHEVESFGGAGRMVEALRSTFHELKPGGRVIIRDFAKPSLAGDIYMDILSDVGLPPVPPGTKPEDIDYNLLSPRALFERFHQEFRGGNAFDYQIVSENGREYIKLPAEWAHEFYLRKDYTGNWRQEIKEKYGYWTMEEAEGHLRETGYTNIRIVPDPNAFIVKNRLEGKIGLRIKEDDKLTPIPFPATHMVVIGEKPLDAAALDAASSAGSADAATRLPEAVDYGHLLTTLSIDREKAAISVDDITFEVESPIPAVGDKKMVFRVKNKSEVLKIVRLDTRNPHNSFKSMLQTIERGNILEEYGVPHARVTNRDPEGPPFRWFTQERIEGGTSAAELIANGELTESDVRQLAELVNKFEKNKLWQLDTNPHNWIRKQNEDGSASLVYVDGKVYRYDEQWEFRRIGLLQWTDPEYIKRGAEFSAAIPHSKNAEDFKAVWQNGGGQIDWWKKYLDPAVAPEA